MAEDRTRHRLVVSGVVQGVGFRPFVYALASKLGLSGSVGNNSSGVTIEIEGPAAVVTEFRQHLPTDAPSLARIDAVSVETVPVVGGTGFEIMESRAGAGRTLVSPDIATCEECLAELEDPADRRYRHPFISCTNCGPRFTIVTDLPYDRPVTTMAPLPLCTACAGEYADPTNRRFHAQTVACPDCGPTLTLRRPGQPEMTGREAMSEARRLLAGGAIVAVKGLGGYHLACDAADQTAVSVLRKRKDRGDKPFAIMVADEETAAAVAFLTDADRRLLADPRRPVVLLPRRPGGPLTLAPDVAPDSPDLGIMLPYTPVHRLLFGLVGDPPGPRVLVMTSGNLSGEPIVTDDGEAVRRLAPLADAWLSHDRRIHVPCDDSVLRIVDHDQLPVRRSRGYAPLPVALPMKVLPAVAVGSDLKNTFCVGDGRYAWLSGHIGDMDDLATLQAFDIARDHMEKVTGVQPEIVIADRHPGYRSSAWAQSHAGNRELIMVQHHHAHLASVMAENGHLGDERVVGFAFDGTGYGDDRAVWGGEIMIADYRGYERAGHLRYTPLPGGDAGVRNPCRMALSHLRAAGQAWDPRLPSVAACGDTERSVLSRQLEIGLNTVPTSSMGRLFDAVSSLAGVCHRIAYEAEAAMRFEGIARAAVDQTTDGYEFTIGSDGEMIIADPAPVIGAVVADVTAGTPPELIASRFHLAVAEMMIMIAERLRAATGIDTVALSGGVFLNVLLTRLAADRLQDRGFRVLRHHLVPPSDAGIALGQLVIGSAVSTNERSAPCA
jgi:hydrogenase maturation protein HypF